MRKMAILHSAVFLAICSIICISCAPEPTAAFSANATTITAGETVQFTDQSENEPTIWLWTFQGGTPSSSSEQNPAVRYSAEGTYNVTLEVRKRGASNIMTKDDYITVEPSTTDLTFFNNTYTTVYIELLGIEKAVNSGEAVTFFDLDGSSVAYYAYTSGQTSTGTQIGLSLGWEYTLSLPGGELEVELDISSDFFFLRIANNGTHVLSPLEVYHGSAEPHTENIRIPTDGVQYRIGYYNAVASAEVIGYFEDDPETWVYWDNLNYANTVNQSVDLQNTFKKGTPSQHGPGMITGDAGQLLPAAGFIPGKTAKEGHIRQAPNKY